MGKDTIARGISLANAVYSNEVALLVFGQSTEYGQAQDWEQTAYPLAFRSAIDPGFVAPFGSDVPRLNSGGWLAYVHDALNAAGYKVNAANAAVPGINLVTEVVGYVNPRGNTTLYYGQRASVGYPDRGDYGQILTFGGKFFRATTANLRDCFSGSVGSATGQTGGYQNFVGYSGSLATAASAPDVSATAVGATVTDGSITLTCVNPNYYTSEASFQPGGIVANNGNSSLPNLAWNGVIGERNAGRGFDPLGVLQRAHELGSKLRGVRRIVYFAHGQANLTWMTSSAVQWQSAVIIAMNFFLQRGWEVMIGNTVYSGCSAAATLANYQAQVTACDNAVSVLQAIYGASRVHRGPNHFALMGSDGPMGSQRITGSVSSNVLTVSAVDGTRGTGVATGQRVFYTDPSTGQFALKGTTTGPLGGGTYSLSSGVDITSSTLQCVGAWIQGDGVHPNAAGYVGPDVAGRGCYGKQVANSLLSILQGAA